jgi:DNA-binding GntR family transcriptional regulator
LCYNSAMADEGVRAGSDGASAARKVSRGIMRGLELEQLVPGQRLIETELALQFGVGRNAVREAIQWLSALGVIDVSRNRSPAIRRLDRVETEEVLVVAAAAVALVARSAAEAYRTPEHGALLDAALEAVADGYEEASPGAFGRARRHFYQLLLTIGGNRELARLFRGIGLQILYAQHRSAGLRRVNLPDLQAIGAAVAGGDAAEAAEAARRHIANIRTLLSGP